MARQIDFKLVTPDPRPELARRLAEAPVEHAEALLSAYDLLEKMHASGVLDTLRGLLGAGDEVVTNAVSLVTRPEAVRAQRNLLALTALLASLDPEVLHRAAAALPRPGEGPAPQPPSLFSLLRRLASANSRRALAVLAGVLEGAGSGFGERK